MLPPTRITLAKSPTNEHYDAAVSTGQAGLDGELLTGWLQDMQARHPHWEGRDGERAVIIQGNPAYIAARTPGDVLDAVRQLVEQVTADAES